MKKKIQNRQNNEIWKDRTKNPKFNNNRIAYIREE